MRRDGTIIGACLIGDLAQAPDIEQALRPTQAQAQPQSKTEADTASPQEADSDMHKMTESFLKDSFAGESQAHMKYRNFAEKADDEGNANVARLFRPLRTPSRSTLAHLATLDGIGSSSGTWRRPWGEGFEIDEMYPAYIVVAEDQGEDEAKITSTRLSRPRRCITGCIQAKEAVDAARSRDRALWSAPPVGSP